ncbi:hypothetical protein HBA91_01735 [Ochrobactrum sp. MR34]|nr:hypothetical protein [Ochrobactrum sp. MR34]
MCVDFGFPLTLENSRAAAVEDLLLAIKVWLNKDKPLCLVHPHGFYIVPVHKTEIGDWRFHLWPEGERKITGMPAFIHNHDRHVESRVLRGKLSNVVYDVRSVPVAGLPLYSVEYDGDRYAHSTSNFLYKTSERVVAQPILRQSLSKGEFYHVERHAYHEAIVPVGQVTATLAYMHRRVQGVVSVVGCDGYPDRMDFTRQTITATEIADLI